MKLFGTMLELVVAELGSDVVDVTSVNKLPIGETCVEFTSVDGEYKAFFKDKTGELTSLLQVRKLAPKV
jgi:hypothetical protein